MHGIKFVMEDGGETEHGTVKEAAKHIGVGYTRLSNWIYHLDKQKRGLPAVTRGWRKYGIADIVRIPVFGWDGKDGRGRKLKQVMIVWDNGKKEVFPSKTELAEKLGRTEICLYQWIKGINRIPRKTGIASISYMGETVTSRVWPEQRVMVKRFEGREFWVENLKELSAMLGVEKSSLSLWINGKRRIPKKHGIKSIRWENRANVSFSSGYENATVNKKKRTTCRSLKLTMSDGSEAVFDSGTAAAASVGATHTQFTTWMYIIDNRDRKKVSGKSILNSQGWRRFGIEKIERMDGKSNNKVTPYHRGIDVVWANGKKETLDSQRELMQRLKHVSGKHNTNVTSWLKGQCCIPPEAGIKSLAYAGKPPRSKIKRRLMAKRFEGREFSVDTVKKLSELIGVGETWISLWINGHKPISRKHGLESVWWEGEKNLSYPTQERN